MRAALAVWDGRISPVFDASREALVLTIENGAVSARTTENIETPTAALRPDRLVELGRGSRSSTGPIRLPAPRPRGNMGRSR